MQHRAYIREVAGADTAVLFVHGIVGSPAHFGDLVPLVPEDWSVCNLLLDGHGKGVKEFAATSMYKWKAQVSGQLDLLLATHSRVFLVAHSMGTLFAIDEAIRRPQQVAGLFLLAVPLYPRVPPSTAWSSVMAALGRCKPGSTAAKMVADSSVRLSPNLFRYLTWLPRFWELLTECRATRRKLPQLRTPARCYQSRHDELVSHRACGLLAAQPSLTLTVLPDSGHFAYTARETALLQREFTEFLQNKNADIN